MLERGTINGYGPHSTWARGQAWAMHGLASAHRATGDYREEAERAAGWFLDRLPEDAIPPWDFDAPPGGPLDASAGAIAASALLELGREEEARSLLGALVATCLNRGDGDGLLLHCCYRQPIGHGLDCATVWGDFFLLEALTRIERPERRPDPLA
jgi:unsaturated chondroitin disaccharide hydrolase